MIVEHDVELGAITTFRTTGARASNFYRLLSLDDVMYFASEIARSGNEWLVLGGGSNVLLTRSLDHVARVELDRQEIVEENKDNIIVRLEAGVSWHSCVEWAVNNGWSGIEAMALIPGSVGAAPIQNIGAYGQQLSDSCLWVEGVTVPEGNLQVLSAEHCRFGYRDSVFKHLLRNKFIITAVALSLQKSSHAEVHYAELQRALAPLAFPTIRDVFECVIRLRTKKLPPPELGNAGSFFKNPIISHQDAQRLLEQYPTMPYYPSNGAIKLSAGWLIEQCGYKGKRYGSVGVYEHHALVLVNFGDASGNQVVELAEQIKRDVRSRFGLELEEEVLIV